ncbi:ribosomal L28 family-domain-containing protein [Talaromyces proteolyticus]|uniref:Large ribosomal subunit protein bL28m n=1 Tax=Talaromyces proteolyticus TaxID=1131652 RepID=A0AAD4PYF1_9EURO|nr:ribosomal L28 family-domain-containing protein [Talaromyces proteolyticus]KAH8697679.1 ribosomal L28 family-domain-containing protein [Talaromyces proteolyticus]
MLSASSLRTAFRGLSLDTPTSIKRSFSTTSFLQKRKTLSEEVPPYPYKPNYLYKQADTGLYGGVSIDFGNKISKGKNKGKTRRSWKPNVRWKKLHSDALDEDVFIKVTRKALRTIRKCNGLDNYLLSDKPARIKELGLTGWELRWKVMQTPKIQARFSEQRKKLGLAEPPKSFEEWLRTRKQIQWRGNTPLKERVDIKDKTPIKLEQLANLESLKEQPTQGPKLA